MIYLTESLRGMLILTFLTGFLTLTQSLHSFPKLCDVQDFDDYLQQTGKVYTDEKERQYREAIFIGKKAVVDMGNKYATLGLSSFQMAINPLADLTHKETLKLLGSKITYTGE